MIQVRNIDILNGYRITTGNHILNKSLQEFKNKNTSSLFESVFTVVTLEAQQNLFSNVGEILPLYRLDSNYCKKLSSFLMALETLGITTSGLISILLEPLPQHQTYSSLHQNIFHILFLLLNLQHPFQLLELYGPEYCLLKYCINHHHHHIIFC